MHPVQPVISDTENSSIYDRETVVLGGGISGLYATYLLQGLYENASVEGNNTDVSLIEKSSKFGGLIGSKKIGNTIVDTGPDAFLARSTLTHNLCIELGLESTLVTPQYRQAYIYVRGSLRPLPQGLVLGVPTDVEALKGSDLLSESGVSAVQADLDREDIERTSDTPYHTPEEVVDRSIGELLREHIGNEATDNLVAPLLSGINAGDIDRMSAHLIAPQLFEAACVAGDGSLIKQLQKNIQASAMSVETDLIKSSSKQNSAPIFYGLRNGMQTLSDGLLEKLAPQSTFADTSILSLTYIQETKMFLIETTNGTFASKSVISSLPSYALHPLLHDFVLIPTHGSPQKPYEELSKNIAQLSWASVALTIFVFPKEAVPIEFSGSGFLVDPREGLLLTACSFGSSKWKHWDSYDQIILRASVGRANDTRFEGLTDSELVLQLRKDLQTTMGIPTDIETIGLYETDVFTEIIRYPQALPQYEPGHAQQVDTWQSELNTHTPGFFLSGASTQGVGIPACLKSAKDAVTEVSNHLGNL